MMHGRWWRVFTGIILLLSAALCVTACGDGDSLPSVKPAPDAGSPRAQAVAATALVSGGTVMRSTRYRLLGSMAAGVADGSVGASKRLALKSVVLGASQ
jgi:hypothetical protein